MTKYEVELKLVETGETLYSTSWEEDDSESVPAQIVQNDMTAQRIVELCAMRPAQLIHRRYKGDDVKESIDDISFDAEFCYVKDGDAKTLIPLDPRFEYDGFRSITEPFQVTAKDYMSASLTGEMMKPMPVELIGEHVWLHKYLIRAPDGRLHIVSVYDVDIQYPEPTPKPEPPKPVSREEYDDLLAEVQQLRAELRQSKEPESP